MFTKDDSKQGISVEKLKAEIIEKLNHRTAEATRRLVKISNSIPNLSQTIAAAENEKCEAEIRLQRLQEQTEPDKKTLDAIRACVLELQTFDRTLEGWKKRLEALNQERAQLLHGVKAEVGLVLAGVKADMQRKTDAEAAKLLALLISTEEALEQCRWVDRYVPCFKGVNEVVHSPAYYMECPPRELWVWLKQKMRALGGLS